MNLQQAHKPQTDSNDNETGSPHLQYNIGKNQNSPVHLPTFLRKNEGDPALKVRQLLVHCSCPYLCYLTLSTQDFLRKLRKHLLPRIQKVLQEESEDQSGALPRTADAYTSSDDCGNTSQVVFFKSDRIYHHKLSRFHFTTYDVRRGTDIINPGTSRHNIMLLADNSSAPAGRHKFLYARVLGVYHANVVYTGPGMRDFEARRMDFLWVRWYEVVEPMASGWEKRRLDRIRFPRMDEEDAFGFVDPKDVLRGCHIMPRFSAGKRYPDGRGMSRCAKDSQDYKCYYVGR